ncbi:TetR/AcrR family transcriptional regulator [Acidiphilium sp.]|uniref:TetR/AcrR family transcriptional regulator n=1 Tax=unclassified Acidiphilium TaxID=2617493 RepID=UPI000BD3BB48|nr:TetR/AcrR family transcriptional regulator [Acidiphilium sp.]OYV55374.1 MAG: TetR family transcriptional regulator [Acidiphilium sp. 20-67-58]HQT61892.1 helix-turn-helix domain-containing protein [Acidiphilium sp.]
MRVSKEQVAENRKTILEAAGRLFRERGFEAVTVTDVMKAAGLTHGGFYGYFSSKDELIGEALAVALCSTRALPDDLPTFVKRYLSPAHRAEFARGCPVVALASETIRQPGAARAEMTAGLKRQIDAISHLVASATEEDRRRAAIGTWAAMVGAMTLARLTDDRTLSDEILHEVREWLTRRPSCGE